MVLWCNFQTYVLIGTHVVMSYITFSLLGFLGSAVAFQTIGNRCASTRREIGAFWNNRSYNIKLAAVKDGGMDAFTAQLKAAYAEAAEANLGTVLKLS